MLLSGTGRAGGWELTLLNFPDVPSSVEPQALLGAMNALAPAVELSPAIASLGGA